MENRTMKRILATLVCALVFTVLSSVDAAAQKTITISKVGKAPVQSRTGNEVCKMAVHFAVTNSGINELYRATLNNDKTSLRYLESYSIPFDLHVNRSNGEAYILRNHGTFSTSAGSPFVTLSIPALNFYQTVELPGNYIVYDPSSSNYLWDQSGQFQY